MSIKVIGNDHIGSDTGIKKRINAGAEKLVFDILQATQYSNPIPSSVRELVTNACDAQKEKEIALEILTGKAQVSDYYIERHGEQYEDSNFDSSYYNLDRLDKINNDIIVTYIQRDGVGFCDEFVVQDYGVGIGSKRLEGILELGYSTKRNTAHNFGAFGLGAKVALSTGVDFYTIETVYNGMRFKANCYNYKTDFVIPKFNLETGNINPSITLSDGSIVYYEETNALNNTKISFGVKKFNRQRFEDAVEEQLTYLSNVKFFIQREDGTIREEEFKARVLYNSNNLIVSSSYMYNKPHIVIVKEPGSSTGINYGYVDFRELEMEQLYGAVGLKCPIRQVYKDEDGNEVLIQDGVEVTPSREKVIWNDNTKQYVQNLIVKAAEEATDIIQESMKETDFLKWVDACRNVLNDKINSDPAVAALARIIDRSAIKPKYSLDPSIKWGPIESVFYGMSVKEHSSYIKDKTYHSKSEDLDRWEGFNLDAIYFKEENSYTRLKDFYLMEQHGGKFLTIYPKNLNYLVEKINEAVTDEDAEHYQKEHDKRKMSADKLIALIKQSSVFKTYEDVVVPDDFESKFKIKEDVVYNAEDASSLTHEERRKLNQQIVAFTLRDHHNAYRRQDASSLTWDKVEPKLSTLQNLQGTIYYGTDEHADLIREAAWITRNSLPAILNVYGHQYGSVPKGDSASDKVYFWGCAPDRFVNGYLSESNRLRQVEEDYVNLTPQFLKVSEANVKIISKFPNFKPINQFYRTTMELEGYDQDQVYTVDKHLKLAFNRKYTENLEYDYLYKLKNINPIFKTIASVIEKIFNESNELPEFIKEDLNKLYTMQEISKSDSVELIEQTSKELFVLSDIKTAVIQDQDIINIVEYVKAFNENVQHILCEMNDVDTAECNKEVYSYLNWRQKFDIEIPVESIKNVVNNYNFNIDISEI